MYAPDVLQALFRWFHIIAGVMWIGLLYFFNFVNGPLGAALDAETKKKVVPELMPRALFWFRWGAAFTWVTGVLLLALVFYHGALALEDQSRGWTAGALLMLPLTFAAPLFYELAQKCPITKPAEKPYGATISGFLLITIFCALTTYVGGFSYRGTNIHLGAALGTIMAFNVWFRIWPAQQKIITAVKNGEAPDAATVKLAGTRSKHNTYMSVPLLWMMINAHTTFAAGHWTILLLFVLFGWHGVQRLYKKAGTVKGF